MIVSAPDEKHELVAKVIKELDDAQAVGEVTVKVYRLENADATAVTSALVGTLQSAAAGASSGRGRGRLPAGGSAGQLRISPDPSSNSIVVRASKEDHARIAQLISQMDTAQVQRYPVRTIALKNADADSVARTLSALFGGSGAQRAGRAGPAGTARRGRGRRLRAAWLSSPTCRRG